MDLTAGSRATAATAAVAMATGFLTILYGVARGDVARSLGGVCLAMTALTPIALLSTRQWVTDTREERQRLADAVRAAQDERDKYVAAQAALENEQQRLLRDAAANRSRAVADLLREREKMEAELEEKRATLICETLAAAPELLRNLDKQPQRGRVIDFPNQQPAQAPERERSRGHNVVGP